MVEIITDANCGNSPKALFLQQFNIAFAELNVETIADSITDDVIWTIVGDKQLHGKADVVSDLQSNYDQNIVQYTISTVITHGKHGAVNGEIKLDNGSLYAFCDVYEFSNAKGNCIKSMTSYGIELKPPN